MQFRGPVFDGSISEKVSQNPEEGEKITVENQPSTDLYVIIAGYCFASAATVDEGKPSLLGPGDYFGERSVLSLGLGDDGKESTRTVWARGTHKAHSKIHEDLQWPTHEWIERDKKVSQNIVHSSTNIRVLSGATLAEIFKTFPDAEAKMHKVVNQKKRLEDEAMRKKYIVDKFFPGVNVHVYSRSNDAQPEIVAVFNKTINKLGRTGATDALTPTDIVEILRPHRKWLISNAVSDEGFTQFVKEEFDKDSDGHIQLKEFEQGIVNMKKKASSQLLEVRGLRRKTGVMTEQERRSMTTDAKVEEVDKKVDEIDAKVDAIKETLNEKLEEIQQALVLMQRNQSPPALESD